MKVNLIIMPAMRIALIAAAFAAIQHLKGQTFTAAPISSGNYNSYPYHFTGLLTAPLRSSGYVDYGSGAVVKNPRVVYSCAHVVFDKDAIDPWLNGVRWYRAWGSVSQPSVYEGQALRSYYYYVGYASSAKINGNSSDSFSQDFVVHYAYEDTGGGGYAGWWTDGVAKLQSSSNKLVTGYPTGLYSSGDARKYQMHQTGPFSRAFTIRFGDYMGISEVSTGPGNSGGPVWVSDGSVYYFAGVVVSGLERSLGNSTDSSGVYGLDSSSASLIDAAITAGGGSAVAPVFVTQPTSRRVTAGEDAVFFVSVTGVNLAYRWLFNGVAIPNATSATLTIARATLENVGNYQAIVSNSGGEIRSTVVTLSVDLPSKPSAPGSIYATESASPGRLFSVNNANGGASAIATTTFLPGLEFRKNGVLYGSSSVLSVVSTSTGLATVIGELPELIVSIAFSPNDELYGLSNYGRTLYKIDPQTGRGISSVALSGTTFANGQPFAGEIMGIDFGPDGRLYGIGAGLYGINVTTGVASRITPLGSNISGDIFGDLDFGPDGLLRSASYGTTSILYVISPSTGIGQRVGPMGALVSGIATVPAAGTTLLGPTISSQPAGVSVSVGQTATFSVTASGSSPLSYQWQKDGVSITGATNSSFAITGVSAINSGAYSVTVSNSAGSVVSKIATLSVNAVPQIAIQPVSQSIAAGKNVTFSVVASGTPAPLYQWRFNGENIAGATGASLTISNPQTSDAGGYSVVVSNAAGSVVSAVVELAVSYSRIVNLSILTTLSYVGDSFTIGYVVGGKGTSGSKDLLLRAAGPSLGALGVSGTLDDPKIEFFRGSAKSGENDNWGGGIGISNAMSAVGAFAYTGPASKDSAATLSLPPGDNSVQVSGVGNSIGTVIAEIYDATPASKVTSDTARLVNVSVLKQLGNGFTVGFVVAGNGPKNILVRAIGPTLSTAFGVGGTLADPQISLYSGQSLILTNDNWNGSPSLVDAFSAVGAFVLPAASRDAVISAKLNPGNYTVQVSGVGGITGIVLVEIYEIP